jgi:Meckel syndrome type 1 protein
MMTAARAGNVAGVAFLLEHGADVDARDGGGHTALHLAAQGGQVETVRVLLARGEDRGVVANGSTAAEVAEARGRAGVADVIRGRASPVVADRETAALRR